MVRILERAPYQVPSGEDEERNTKAEGGLHTLYIQTGGIDVSKKEDDRGGESNIPSPHGKKRAASKDLEAEASKQRKKPLPRGPAPEGVLTVQRPQEGQPSNEP